jgi:hypothetical protein
MSALPDFSRDCEKAVLKLWGDPDRKTPKQYSWKGNGAYSRRTYDPRKHVWYDAGLGCGGSTLELIYVHRHGKPPPESGVRGKDFFACWRWGHEQGLIPDAPPPDLRDRDHFNGLAVIRRHRYEDEDSKHLQDVCRLDTNDPDLKFRPQLPSGEWKAAKRQVLYRLPQLIATPIGELVAYIEGERDADTMSRLGLASTTHAGGVFKYRKSFNKHFKDRDVVVCGDFDATHHKGEQNTDEIAAEIAKTAKRVRVLIAPDGFKDMTEWAERGGGTAAAFRNLVDALPDYVPAVSAKPEPEQKRGYMQGKTALACNVGNVLLALDQESDLKGAFAYDEMLRTEVLLRPLFADDPNFKPRPVTDTDVTSVQAHLQWFGFRRLGKNTTHDAIDKHARLHAFHPVRDYLNGLQWDGVERLPTWLHVYLAADKNNYTAGIGTMFPIGMVARIYKPGCKLDYMPVIEGEQGVLKSTACRILAGAAYFSDQLPDITSKEASQHLRGKWLVEVAELRAYSRAAIDHFKEFLTRDTERYRPPFGRKEIHEPRQCCFIGTTNKSLYLRDETGNRRFWPLKAGKLDLDLLQQDRDQLLAEAVVRFRRGEQWWPDAAFERKTIAAQQEARYEPDVWEKPVADFLARLPEGDLLRPKRTTILDVAIYALDFEDERPTSKDEPRGTPINRLTPKDQQRIARVLTHLQWEPKHNERGRWWEQKQAAADTADDG